MPQPLGGLSLPLQLPQNLYPSQLLGAPYDYATNQVALPSGTQIPVPAGTYYVGLGMYLLLEYLDPVLGVWVTVAQGTTGAGPLYVKSDGGNYRVANRTACPVGGIVLVGGSAYVQATTSIAVTGGGGSTWLPIVGGALVSASVASSFGAGYGVPPIVIIPAPPPGASNPNGVGGKPASGYATISGGSVTSVVLTDQGAGYPAGFTITLLPNITDPNINTGITNALWAFTTGFAGSVTGVICTNPGNAIATPSQLSLTVSGAGTQATVAPVMLTTLTAFSVSVGGAGFGSAAAGASVVDATMGGGGYPRGSITLSRELNNIMIKPRPGQIQLAISGTNGSLAAQSGTIIDGGLFFQQGNNAAISTNPNFMVGQSGGTAGSIIGPAVVYTMGGTQDVVVLQPAP